MRTKFLDIGFYILLPEDVEIPFQSCQDLFTWGGEHHPQGGCYYKAGEYIKFTEIPLRSFVLKYLPVDYRGISWKMYCVDEECLRLIKDQAMGIQINWSGLDFESFLSKMLSLSKFWVVILLRNQEEIDTVCSLNFDSLIEKIDHMLRPGNYIEGLFVYSKQE